MKNTLAQDEMLRVEDLSFQIDKVRLLSQIGFSVKRHEFVGLIGPNGCGKSTLLKNIYRQYQPSEGTVYLDGTSIQGIKNKDMARMLSVVTQESNIEFDFSVWEMVMMGRYPYHKILEQNNEQDREICEEALNQVGMGSFRERSFLSLSGGEKQRVFLAMAFAQKSRVIILDEPTNHLDIGYQLLIMDTMRRQRETTIFTSVHDMNIAARYCDRILVMDKGHLIASGDPKEVLTPELIRKVFHVNAEIWKNPADGSLQVTYQNYAD